MLMSPLDNLCIVGPLPTWGHPFGLLLEQLAVVSFSDGSIVHNQPYHLCDNRAIAPYGRRPPP